jgi:V-type H+-transporting ATPase subunit a
LFALSLAHAKLSHLLLDFLLSTLSAQQATISLIRCVVFFMTTVGMMLMLDVMECLMHVVRLHWVEWMGKFYTGTGVLFQPEIEDNFK